MISVHPLCRFVAKACKEYRLLLLVLILSLTSAQSKAQSDIIDRKDTLQEVVVTSQAASRRLNDVQIGVEKLDVEFISRLPAIFGERDPIKGLQYLPGVKGEGDGLGGYQVRGGTSAQNNVLLDGASVYNVGHLVGLFSAFNDDAIGSMDLYKGLMPARFGGGSSSVLTMSTRTGDNTAHHLSASVGILSAKVEADGPMSKNSTYLAAARTSYLNLFIKSLNKYRNNSLSFYDLNAKLHFRLSDNDQLNLSLFRSNDVMDVEKMVSMEWSNTFCSLGWLHTNGTKGFMLTQLLASDYSTDEGMDVYSFNLSMQGYNRQLTLRHQETWTPDKTHTINFGGESTLIGLQSAAWRILSNHEREKRDGWFSAVWASDDISLFDKHLQISGGLRMEWFSALGGKPFYKFDDNGEIIETMETKKWKIVKSYPVLQPRFSVSWKIGEVMALKAGYSRLAQAIQPIRNSSMTIPIDRLALVSNYVKPQVADQVAAGITMMTKDASWDFSADTYWKKIKDVYDFRDGNTFNSEIELEKMIIGGRGRAYGFEFAAHKNKGPLTGWAAYTLSWVENQIDGVMNGRWYTGSNDRRHDLVAVAMYQLNERWSLSSIFRYTTGQAMTAPSGKYDLGGETHFLFGDRNESRAPAYHRLDLSATYSKPKKKATQSWTFGIYNVYNRYNPFLVTFKDDPSKPNGTKAEVTTLFGIVPTISFAIKY
jgi:hypothetical protein